LSRKPVAAAPPLDVERILDALDGQSVAYILIGGIAASLHGSPLATWGVDITPSADEGNLGRLAAALRDLGAPDGELFAARDPLTLTTPAGLLGVYRRPPGGQSYATLATRAETYEVFGLRVRVASLDDLIKSKLALARNKDLAAVPYLLELQRRRG
jgi:hypothetical protein